MSKIIEGHNEKVTSKTRGQRQNCNSRKKAECKRERNCQVNNVVCKCDVTRPLQKKVYLGLAERENGRAVSITKSYHLITRDIITR